ncbi:putative ubiquitin carboxyl-terminal hydrolase 3 [Penicillium rolfsii]|nr:putative ubiquitin carboxyl-terminal hydrolase 3 [Penicillium rolfsii]
MNHHLPAMPHGQPPMPPSRRQSDFYNPAPPNMRAPAYMGYPPHMNGHMPPAYSPQQFPPWYPPYGHMQQMPPRPYQPPYGPMIVSSYPQAQPIMAPTHMPSHSFSSQPRTSSPMQPTMSLSIPTPLQPEMHDPHVMLPMQQPHPPYGVASTPPRWEPKPVMPDPKHVFKAPVPWLSVPNAPFPARPPFRRKNIRPMPDRPQFPPKDGRWIIGDRKGKFVKPKAIEPAAPVSSEPQTPTTSVPPSEGHSTQATTPSPTAKSQTQKKDTKPPIPIVPVVPNTPVTSRREVKDSSSAGSDTPKSFTTAPAESETGSTPAVDDTTKPTSPARSAPKSWADLVRSKNAARAPSASASPDSSTLAVQKSESLAEVLNSLGEDVTQYSDKIAFLEPRGLVNTGNMCYMNSVLQILVSCVPFHQFLDHVGRRAAHSFHSDMPLIDAMIMFMREFNVIDAAASEDQLRLRLKPNELEQYGEAFVPEFVYEMIRQLPRFRDMRRGHQQDAQEFLGFLLEELHEECDRAAKHLSKSQGANSIDGHVTNGASGDGEWLEVGHKQKAAVTQSSGAIATESPITRIFGGKLRSEFKVPGNKTSVTMEPYQPLQLDIGAPDVHNIIDALKGLTKPESIQGDFNSARGPNVTATKQIFIETLPPVLILHLKRFQYDSLTGATQKIWKKVGYPLDLEIPREVFPAHRRNALTAQGGLPKYRLMGVIYHHGKNASGGHYTVDVRRQDGREWIRMDDTVIRRVRSEDVAEAGGEEDPKVLAAALEQHRQDKIPRSNMFENIDQDDMESADSEKGWSQVSGSGSSGHSSKKSINMVTPSSGPSSGVRTPLGRYGSRDNRVAYLLFYQRIA